MERADRIALLEPEVVARIAAGEVIDRPASVVKELLENAFDAGATTVEIDGGGERLRVSDDGCGMSRDEVELAVQRHATSKLRRLEDLAALSTMGFRGEGLAAIAAVARLVLHTRTVEDEVGWRVELEGGRLLDGGPRAREKGTTVVVDRLFFNTPARAKFLKSSAAETALVTDTVAKLACAFPGVQLRLRQGSRMALDLPRAASRLERVRAVLGRRGARVRSFAHQWPDLAVECCLAPPEESMRSARQLTLLVNSRPVKDRALLHAAVEGCGLGGGRYPVGVIYIDIEGDILDVNVHPQKAEVRFADPRTVFRAVRRCAAESVAEAGDLEQERGERSYPLPRSAGYLEHSRRVQEATRRFWSAQLGSVAKEEATTRSGGPEPSDESRPGGRGGFARLRLLGQALDGVLVCEDDRGLVLIRTQVARARIALAGLQRSLQRGAVPAQRLLIPATVELDRAQQQLVEQHGGLLERLGLELESFGDGTWMVRSVPEALRQGETGQLVRQLLDLLASAGDAAEQQLDQLLQRWADLATREQGIDCPGEQLLQALDRSGLELAVEARPLGLRDRPSGQMPALALRVEGTLLRGEAKDAR